MNAKIPKSINREVSFWGLSLTDLMIIAGFLSFGVIINIDPSALLLIILMAIGLYKLAIKYREKIHGLINFQIYPERMNLAMEDSRIIGRSLHRGDL